MRRRLCEVVDPEGKTVAFSTFSLRFVQVDGETIGLYRAAGFATSGVGFNPYMARLVAGTGSVTGSSTSTSMQSR